MWEQAKALQEGAEIVVCTPVREKPTFISLLHFKVNLPIAAVNPPPPVSVCSHRVVSSTT